MTVTLAAPAGAVVEGRIVSIGRVRGMGIFLVLLAVRSLRQSRTGRALIATRDNEPAARAAALNTTRHKLIAFMVSGAIAGFAGGQILSSVILVAILGAVVLARKEQ